MKQPDLQDELPLKPAWFHVLLTLAEEPAHGYSIRKTVESRTNGKIKLWPTTLYGALSDLTDRGFIVETGGSDQPQDNLGRIRYRLTERGHKVLQAEASRLEALVHAARAAGGVRPSPA